MGGSGRIFNHFYQSLDTIKWKLVRFWSQEREWGNLLKMISGGVGIWVALV